MRLFLLLTLLIVSCSWGNPSETDAFEDGEFDDEFTEIEETRPLDPLGGYNRLMTNFNDKAYIYLLDPIASGYKSVASESFRKAVSNFFNNLSFPIRFTNNLIQLKFENSSDELSRFLINSTFGFGGIGDPAKEHFKIEAHREDFGQTLGYYNVGAGFHIVLPFLGPSNLRDSVGLLLDSFTTPTNYIENREYNLVNRYEKGLLLDSYDRVNSISFHQGEYENIKKDAIDLYPFLREAYEQSREKLIKE